MEKNKLPLRNNHGFTLMEVMVALFILSIMSVVAVSGLNAVLRSQSKQVGLAHQLQSLQFTYSWLEQDIGEYVDRSTRSAHGELLPSMMLSHDQQLSQVGLPGLVLLILTRGGIIETPQTSSLQRVAYSLVDSQLIRYVWPVLDVTTASVPRSQVLLSDVAQIQIRHMSDQGTYFNNWQDYTGPAPLPLALEWHIRDHNGREVVWVFPIIGGGSEREDETKPDESTNSTNDNPIKY